MTQTQGLAFSVESSADVPQSVITDSLRLRQILKNLLTNAFKFTAAGQIQVRFECASEGWSSPNESLVQAPLERDHGRKRNGSRQQIHAISPPTPVRRQCQRVGFFESPFQSTGLELHPNSSPSRNSAEVGSILLRGSETDMALDPDSQSVLDVFFQLRFTHLWPVRDVLTTGR